jgi:Uma2 family endonuclease
MIAGLRVPKKVMNLTNDELFDLCAANSDLNIERNANGELIIMSPTGGLTGNRSSRILFALYSWNNQYDVGFVFDSSTGFLLPDGSMRSPDCSWVSKPRWQSLTRDQQEKFPPITPDFLVELRSPSDDLGGLRGKMNAWIENGARLAWLIDPIDRKGYSFAPERPARELSFDDALSGEDVLPGFFLKLESIE